MPDTKIPAEIVDDLKAKHGEDTVEVLTAGDYQIVVRRPGRQQWRRFRKMVSDPNTRPDAIETLTRDCLLYPDRQAFEAMVDKRPALAEVFGDALGDLAGASLVAEKNV